MSALPPPLPRPQPAKVRARRPLVLGCTFAAVLALAAGAFVAHRLVEMYRYLREHPTERSPGEIAFRRANRLIISGHGRVAFGNTPDAVRLAENFSKELKAVRAEAFTEGEGKSDLFTALTKSEFQTYCLVSSDACVFLVHVPELRRFSPGAKELMGDLAWGTAQRIVHTGGPSPPARLAVGVKGELSYDPILIGRFVSNPSTMGEGIETRASGVASMRLLHPFFEREEARE